ncbi:hypothetical protein QQ045_021846 [Rhodiola kirilowii]
METDKLREKHEKSWKLYGCTIMSDGWTDKRGRHLINFLVNSQDGTFFLSSVDVSSKIVTDNGANFKAAGGHLCRRITTLYWTPCAAHCLYLMLEDIAKLKEFHVCITHGRNITTFIYRHGRLLNALREMTLGRDIVRPGATRFATTFLTLQSLYKNKDDLRKLFGSKEWWLLQVRDEKSMMLSFQQGKFFKIKENDHAYSSRLRMKFNDVLEKMVVDTDLVMKISEKVDQYENSRNSFGKGLPTLSREKKNPLDWWSAFGGYTIELGLFAKRIVGLCCSSSGCEHNWSTFEFIHTKKRNRLEHQRLNDLVYVQYNRKIATRFQKRLDTALDASEGLQDRRNARRGGLHASDYSSQVDVSSDAEMEENNDQIILNDDEDLDDDYGRPTTSNHESNDRETNEDIELNENI